MSRYVSVAVASRSCSEMLAGLEALGLCPETGDGHLLMLEGSLECAGEPVELRFDAGTCGSVEDFGFVRNSEGAYQLVCGEVDRALLERELLEHLHQQLVLRAVRGAVEELGYRSETVAGDIVRILVRK